MFLWDILRPSDLTAFSRGLPVDQNFDPIDAILPDRTVATFKARLTQLTSTLRAAKFRTYDAEQYIASRPKVVTITDLTLPPLGQKIPLLEQELLEIALSNRDSDFDRVIEQIYDDAETNVRATRARMWLAKGDVITDGKLSITENGLVGLEADWSLDSSHKPTAATLWSDTANAVPLTDERAWIAQMVADGSPRPDRATTSLTVVGYLQANAEYRSAYWGGNAGSKPNLNLSQLNQVRADNGLPPITIFDASIDVDGVTTRILPVNRFVLSTAGLGESQWGLTAQALEATNNRNDAAFTRRDAPGIFTAAYFVPEPPARWTSTAAVGMPVIFDKARLLTATVA